MKTSFCTTISDAFRGTRDTIKSRLKVYLPFIEPLKSIYDDVQAIDLGSGRGEWLELLGENGFTAQGVDLSGEMATICREQGFHASQGDALSFLKDLPDQSQVIVSAFHLVEHLPFNDVEVIVKEALRVLKPAGILIIETPNPENIVVGTLTFYLDPTHIRPIPPPLLSLLVEYHEFEKVKVLRLQESPAVVGNNPINLFNVLNGVSPDYSVVAQKPAEEELLLPFSDVFNRQYGITLEQLTTSYSHQFEYTQAQTILVEQRARADKLQIEAGKLQIELRAAKAKIDELEHALHHWRTLANQLDNKLQMVYKSSSWRITWPMRKLMDYVKVLFPKFSGLKKRPKHASRQSISSSGSQTPLPDDATELDAHARKTYSDLKAALEKRQKNND